MTPENTATVQAVALCLGPPWKFDARDDRETWWKSIIDGTGRALHVSDSRTKGRLSISGHLPRDKCEVYNEDRTEITVSASREPLAIAHDIQRRLIPGYLEAFDSSKARKDGHKAKQERMAQIAESIRKVCDGRYPYSNHWRANDATQQQVYFEGGDATVFWSGDVSIELRSMSPELAIKVAALVAGNE